MGLRRSVGNSEGVICARSAALLAFAALIGVVAVPQNAHAAGDVKISVEARKHFNAGVALLKDPDGARYEEAYREFKTAYAASPSWKILGNLALAAMKLERDTEAISSYEQYLQEAKDLDASERQSVEQDLSVLRASTVTLSINALPADALISDERLPVQGAPVRNRYETSKGHLVIKVRPGHHVITATAEGKPTLTWELDTEPGAAKEHTFDFDAKPQALPTSAATTPSRAATTATLDASNPAPKRSAAPWVALGFTGAFVAGAAVTGTLALGKSSDYKKANDGTDPDRARGLQQDTKTFNLVTDVLLGAAVVGAGVTTYLFLSRPKHEEGAGQGGVSLRLVPQVGLEQQVHR
jgi:hypothetical protein